VRVTPGPRFHVRSGGERHLRLPFTAPESVLTEAVRRLAAAWRAYDGYGAAATAPAAPTPAPRALNAIVI
jgi:hypothetical protein